MRTTSTGSAARGDGPLAFEPGGGGRGSDAEAEFGDRVLDQVRGNGIVVQPRPAHGRRERGG